jgi:lipopolysaccharide transport system permease protein
MLRSLWQYRGFVLGSVRREFQIRYTGSVLGVAWNVLNPLAMILIYTVIFSEVLRARLPGGTDGLAYGTYICSGLLTWGLFTEIVLRSLTVFIDNGNLLKKSNFPRICLPVVVVLSSLVNFAIIYSLFLGFLVVTGRFPGWLAIAAPAILLLQVTLAAGLGVLLGTLNVFFRDVGQTMGLVLQFWFWLTPIVYPPATLPAHLRPWLALNPMVPIIAAYQGIYVRHEGPVWSSLGVPAVVAITVALVGYAVFRRHSAEMVDEL